MAKHDKSKGVERWIRWNLTKWHNSTVGLKKNIHLPVYGCLLSGLETESEFRTICLEFVNKTPRARKPLRSAFFFLGIKTHSILHLLSMIIALFITIPADIDKCTSIFLLQQINQRLLLYLLKKIGFISSLWHVGVNDFHNHFSFGTLFFSTSI